MARRQAGRQVPAQKWEESAEEALSGFREWRVQHPRATLTEIETALDERWARVRARVLSDTALASAAADLRGVPAEERPRCPEWGAVMDCGGQEERTLRTTDEQAIVVTRSVTVCPACARRVFPPGRGTGAAAQE
jgi:hypothetical protein